MRVWAILLILCGTSFAETIYCPYTHKPVYEYNGELKENVQFDRKDFTNIAEDADVINLSRPMYKGVPLDGFDYWFWERNLNYPAKPYQVLTFLVKDEEGNFVWKPYEVNLPKD